MEVQRGIVVGLGNANITGTPWQKENYFIASPSANNSVSYLYINGNGAISYGGPNGLGNYNSYSCGFRPVVRLNSNYHLEGHTSNGNITYTIEEGAI